MEFISKAIVEIMQNKQKKSCWRVRDGRRFVKLYKVPPRVVLRGENVQDLQPLAASGSYLQVTSDRSRLFGCWQITNIFPVCCHISFVWIKGDVKQLHTRAHTHEPKTIVLQFIKKHTCTASCVAAEEWREFSTSVYFSPSIIMKLPAVVCFML